MASNKKAKADTLNRVQQIVDGTEKDVSDIDSTINVDEIQKLLDSHVATMESNNQIKNDKTKPEKELDKDDPLANFEFPDEVKASLLKEQSLIEDNKVALYVPSIENLLNLAKDNQVIRRAILDSPSSTLRAFQDPIMRYGMLMDLPGTQLSYMKKLFKTKSSKIHSSAVFIATIGCAIGAAVLPFNLAIISAGLGVFAFFEALRKLGFMKLNLIEKIYELISPKRKNFVKMVRKFTNMKRSVFGYKIYDGYMFVRNKSEYGRKFSKITFDAEGRISYLVVTEKDKNTLGFY